MRHVEYTKIAEAVESLCVKAAYELPDDVLNALQKAAKSETSAPAKKILEQLIENARLSKAERLPLCQDTGLAVVFVTGGLLATIAAAPKMLSLRRIDDDTGLQTAFRGFDRWGFLRGILQVLAFGANLWALVAILK